LVEIGTVLSFIQAAGIIVGVAYYVLNIQNNQRNQELSLKAQQQSAETRQTQLFLQLYSQYYNKDWVASLHKVSYDIKYQSFDDWWENYGPSNPDKFQSFDLLSHYFEGAGVLVRKGLINPMLVADLLSEEIISYWEKMGPLIEEFRIRTNNPRLGENQEYLYTLLKQNPELKGNYYQG